MPWRRVISSAIIARVHRAKGNFSRSGFFIVTVRSTHRTIRPVS